jgi:hypothetical protein
LYRESFKHVVVGQFGAILGPSRGVCARAPFRSGLYGVLWDDSRCHSDGSTLGTLFEHLFSDVVSGCFPRF